MLKIIVIENNSSMIKIIKTLLCKVSITNNFDFAITYYQEHSLELEQNIKDIETSKLYLISSKMCDSLNVAQTIRKNDWDSEIIFYAQNNENFLPIYQQVKKIFSFLEVNENFENNLEENIIEIYLKKFDNRFLHLQNNKSEYTIYLKNILYITRDKEERKIIIKTLNLDIKINSTLNKIYQKLDNRFIQTHRCCVANTDHIIKYDYGQNYFLLDNGEIVNLLSKNYLKKENFDLRQKNATFVHK